MIAVIAGATGLTGSFLIRGLLADGKIARVISVSRKPTGLKDAKLSEVLVADLSVLATIAVSLKGDAYFCCLGTTIKAAGSRENFRKVDHDAILAFGRVALGHQAKSFSVVSAMGSAPKSLVFYNRVKGETEADLQALGFASLSIFKPAMLTGPRQETRPMESLVTTLLAPIGAVLPEGWRKRIITPADRLAERMRVEGLAAKAGVHVFEAKDI